MQCEDARRRRLVRRLAVSTAVSAALFAGEASADDFNGPLAFGGGLYVGYSFGSGPSGLELGLEAFGTHRFDYKLCSSEKRSGVGGAVQVGLIDFRDVRMTLAARAGGETTRWAAAYSGELGATYRVGEHQGFGIHTGFLAETVLFYGAFRYQWLLNDASAGGGVRFPGTYGLPATCVEGRPLRTATGIARLGPAHSTLVEPRAVQGGERIPELGRAWERSAQMECASVPAFHQLAADLLAAGAPLSLVERALDAADDEIRHALLCARLASRHLGRVIRPALPAAEPRPSLPGIDGLVRLATESWLDGCLGEGAAAAHAARAAAIATDADARSANGTIARDEARHAELAWAVLDFAIRRGGTRVRDEVRALREVECVPASPASAPDGFAAHGRLAARDLDAVTEEQARGSRERLDRV